MLLPLSLTALPLSVLAAQTLARRAAWRAVAREDPERAAKAARALRVLSPFGEGAREAARVALAARAIRGEVDDVEAALATLPAMAAAERAVFALALDAWRGDLPAAARRLDDPAVREAATRQGELALALAVSAEARGPAAACALWRGRRDDALHAVTPEAAGELLVMAAHLGLVDALDALVARSSDAAHPQHAYWRAVALQRAGRGDEARALIERTLAATALPGGLSARLRRLRAHALSAVADDPAVAEVAAAVRARVEARCALGELDPIAPALGGGTLGAVVALLVAAMASFAVGAPREEVLLRLGALRVPAEGWGDAWRFVAYALLHADALHLGVNLLTLASFGRFVERRVGAGWMALVLLLGAASGGVAAAWSSPPGSLVIGASGAVFALIGWTVAHIVGDPRLRGAPEGRGELILLATLLLLQGGYDALSPRVSSGAHLGGLVAGAVVGALTSRRARARPRRALGG